MGEEVLSTVDMRAAGEKTCLDTHVCHASAIGVLAWSANTRPEHGGIRRDMHGQDRYSNDVNGGFLLKLWHRPARIACNAVFLSTANRYRHKPVTGEKSKWQDFHLQRRDDQLFPIRRRKDCNCIKTEAIYRFYRLCQEVYCQEDIRDCNLL